MHFLPTIYVAQTLTGATLTGNAPNTPTVTRGAVTLLAAALASTLAINVPTVTGVSTLNVELREGTTVRATKETTLTGSYATTTYELTAGEKASIVNWANLRLYLIADGVQAAVSWAELETPAGDTDQNIAGATLSSGSSLNVPSLRYVVAAPTIATGNTRYEPAVQHVVAAPTIGTGEAINVPTVRYVVAAPTLGSGSTVQDTHVLTTGAVTARGCHAGVRFDGAGQPHRSSPRRAPLCGTRRASPAR